MSLIGKKIKFYDNEQNKTKEGFVVDKIRDIFRYEDNLSVIDFYLVEMEIDNKIIKTRCSTIISIIK